MKKLLLTLSCLILFASCGGGSGKGGSKLAKNDYLGSLPALYDSYNAEKTAIEQKLETESNKMMAAGETDYNKVQKLFDEGEVKLDELKNKFEADVKAELTGLVGKEIPVSYSADLQQWFTASAKVGELRGDPWLVVTVTAKDALAVPAMKSYDYTLYVRLLGADGATLERAGAVIMPIPLANRDQSFSAGQVILDNQNVMDFNLNTHAADRATLTGIEFITKAEFDNLNQ